MRVLAATLLAAVALSDAGCPCANETLCRPLTTPPAEKEIFAFTTGGSWKNFWGFSTAPTTIALFGNPTPELVCAAHQHNTRLVIGTAFDKEQLGNATARTAYVKSVVANAAVTGIDGFNLDIEGNSANKDDLTALVTELKTAARKANPHAQVTFDLAIFPKGQTAGYDHASLANVLDFIVPMAYDECWGTAVAAANSPLKALAAGMQQYSELGVPQDKIVMGLPWYGWDFPCDSEAPYDTCHITVPEGKQWYGYATQISYTAANVTAEHGSHQDDASATMVTEYFENVSLRQKRHQQWFDNPATLSAKYAEAARLGCRGVAFWTADEVDYETDRGRDMWAALSSFTQHDTVFV